MEQGDVEEEKEEEAADAEREQKDNPMIELVKKPDLKKYCPNEYTVLQRVFLTERFLGFRPMLSEPPKCAFNHRVK